MTEIAIKQVLTWRRALNIARKTVGKTHIDKDPSDKFKISIVLAEHSVIRLVDIAIHLLLLRVENNT